MLTANTVVCQDQGFLGGVEEAGAGGVVSSAGWSFGSSLGEAAGAPKDAFSSFGAGVDSSDVTAGEVPPCGEPVVPFGATKDCIAAWRVRAKEFCDARSPP